MWGALSDEKMGLQWNQCSESWGPVTTLYRLIRLLHLEGIVAVFMYLRDTVAQLILQGPLSVASYISQGYGRGTVTHLHTGEASSGSHIRYGVRLGFIRSSGMNCCTQHSDHVPGSR
jgi:hypothetical protein